MQKARLLGALLMTASLGACAAHRDETVDGDNGTQTTPIIAGQPVPQYVEAAYLDIDIQNGRGYACSAVLIAPKVILTAGHCVANHTNFVVHVGAQSQRATRSAVLDYRDDGTGYVPPNLHDVGLVLLDQPITIASYPTLATAPVSAGTQVTNVGRVVDGQVTNSLWGASTQVRDGSSSGFPYSYVSSTVIQPGDSGGPDFVTGTHQIVAVNSGASSQTQVLARVDLVSAWLRDQIAANGGNGSHTPDAGVSEVGPSADAGAADTGAACSGVTEREPNDSLATATVAPSGVSVCGQVHDGDVDWLRVGFPSGASRFVLSSSRGVTADVGYIQNGQCVNLGTNLATFNLSAGGAGELCLKVHGPAGVSDAWTLTRS